MENLEKIMEKKLEEAKILRSKLQKYERTLIQKAMELISRHGITINYIRPDSRIPEKPDTINVFVDLNGNIIDHSALLFLANGLYPDLFTTYELYKKASQEIDKELEEYCSTL